jgi:hypothetical protein
MNPEQKVSKNWIFKGIILSVFSLKVDFHVAINWILLRCAGFTTHALSVHQKRAGQSLRAAPQCGALSQRLPGRCTVPAIGANKGRILSKDKA